MSHFSKISASSTAADSSSSVLYWTLLRVIHDRKYAPADLMELSRDWRRLHGSPMICAKAVELHNKAVKISVDVSCNQNSVKRRPRCGRRERAFYAANGLNDDGMFEREEREFLEAHAGVPDFISTPIASCLRHLTFTK